MFLALKEIKHEKFRYTLIAIMIMMISYLMFILMGLMLGLANENKAAINSWRTQTVFLNQNANGSLNQSMITSPQLSRKLNRHEALIGQASVVLTRATGGHKDKQNAQLIGLDAQQFIAKKRLQLVAGRQTKNDHEIVVDQGLSTQGYHLGDQVRLNGNGQGFKIVGFVKNAKLSVAPVIYTSLANWRKLRGVNSTVLASGIVADQNVKGSAFPKLSRLTVSQFINKLPGYTAQNNTFTFMIAFLMVISLVIIAVFLYILTMQKMANYAVLRAQGIPARHLVNATLAQAALLMLCGVVGGVIFTWITQLLMPTTVPILMSWPAIGGIGLALIALGMVGALLPVRMILKIDPIAALNN
ncbi:ABC transporter permease [Limosilactobacillus kribbianus]|uniref:ABC transporter permease n=1 Tax=Limosilactobacillus kribbianus TaxID=2982695 RepID=UPI002263D957